ncbi:DNA polymerase III subunit gamma/tau [bacterium]|nr:DNA polymerase III subunit gamma/tau [bacterium]
MSYLVMARRWRPQRFADVVGQEHVTRTLQRAIERKRVAHAYLFTGPRGVGKTTTARLLAMAVNDPNPIMDDLGLPDLDPNNEMNKDIAAGNALDVIEIDGASNNKVDDVRQLRETIKYAPTSLEKKVYIIDEVHMLSVAAFNALLKTLEEPPEHAMFIFATTEAHKVPATVLSRCQRYDFKRIATKEIREQLKKIVTADEINIDEDALTAIAVKADGALRDALSILDQLVAYQGGDAITEDVVRQALGLIGGEIYFRTTDIAASGDVAGALAIANDLTSGGHDPREYLRGLQQHVLRYLFLKAGGGSDELAVSEEDRDRYLRTLDEFADEDLLRIGEWAAESEDLLRDALDPVLRLELLLVRIAKMDRAVDVGALLQRMGVEPGSFRQARTRPKADQPTQQAQAKPAETKPVPEQPAPVSVDTEQADKPAAETTAEPDPEPAQQPEKVAATPDPPAPAPEPETVSSVEPEPIDAAAEADDADLNSDEDEEAASDLAEAESETIGVDQIRKAWVQFCDRVEDMKRLLGSHLEKGAPTGFEDGALEITFDPSCNFEYENVFRNRDDIARGFRSHFGVTARVIAKKGTIPEQLRPPKRLTEGEKRRMQFDEIRRNHPVWNEMVERFSLR